MRRVFEKAFLLRMCASRQQKYTQLVIKKIKIKTTKRYYFISSRMAIKKKKKLMLMKIWGNQKHHKLLVGMKNGTASIENTTAAPQKVTQRIIT